ncbi:MULTISPECIES: bifunctional RecB family nuclease/DEAD/DEAH box helicase [unclassified Microbacterium]|uniref:TM0106 family RecB-like putative nuclease n=1 Tax=unclassified Microbacterium TaxID=2609290 RepID=UPI00214BF98A|nr:MULTISPECIES: bifunctional RecB family nuclease/DEAD/DEAH box helicase [unclassified Microbacterium]MCR2810855.1 TM0106 family RecB-like putative nuclease [Microbacterium sp. zg.B185]WIM19741.1 TM0106 family RecB-like putative nuclease [Microbacterium sp. zg-B185]
MRYIPAEARVIWSASDLKAAAECEFAWLRGIDSRIGRIAAVEEPEDATLQRAGRLGGEHEQRVLAAYRAQFGAGVIEIPDTFSSDSAGLQEAVALTEAALASDADVIYQAAFATEEFVGFADFLVRDCASDSNRPGAWVVQDSKLARRARVTALMQLSAYVDQLDRLGVARADRVELLLGDGTTSVHAADGLLPVFALRRARLRALIADRRLDLGLEWPAIAWGDPRGELGVVACGRCATCDSEVVASRDLLLVAGMRPVQRDRLRTGGITTIDALVEATAPPSRMNPDTFAMLRTQARLQLSAPAGTGQAVTLAPDEAPAVPPYEVVAPKALGALPRPDMGDLFFDFEGDPLYTEGDATVWGIDYLFGWVDVREQYSALWAHSFDEERAALERFLDIVNLHRAVHPDMHIYHYAPYEPTHLLTMAARHGVREADVDRLLRDGVFVDLYPIVRRALRVGSRSYSIKKLEPLYMGDEVRTSDVQKGDDSIVKYVEARALVDDGAQAQAEQILADLADYNRYDCVSTRRLRDWLVDHARAAGLRPSPNPEPGENVYEPSPRALALVDLARDHPEASPEAMALRLGAAGIDYYAREAKTFWATHFLRLREPVSLWEDTRDVVVLDSTRCRLAEDWHRPEGARTDRRVLELRGELAPGTRLSQGSNPFALYDLPAPFAFEPSPRWIHADHRVTVTEVLDDGAIVEENAVDGLTWSELPIALTPSPPPRALNQQVAIDAWADAVLSAAPHLPADPATDILRRLPPRTRSGALAVSTGDDVEAIVRTLVDLDHSYLAVQGPPGTGKTFVGSHVIERLVRERGFKVGVVAQSHAVIENMLDRVVAAGVPRELVAKAPKDPTAADLAFTPIAKNGVGAFAAEHADTGFVIGGTAWDFSHEGRIPRGSLDLLVIDEAGQFSLASTIAVSLAASRLLLLGDPQQLPQVSQGTHPEPVDTSALGWVIDGADVIPAEYGYFLARTWRMHPRVAAPVSRLSYSGELAAHPATAMRELAGVQAGVIPVSVRHHGNATQSPEEAAAVVEIVRDLVGRAWTGILIGEAGESTVLEPRPLQESDIIVVTPYNAQQVAVEEALADAGYPRVPVGTVDRFQGQEAAVAIVSLAASSGRDAPRGLEFLLLRNRLNVAVSRAMHTAYVISSPGLLDDLPYTPDGVVRLSGFARLVGAA